MYFLIAYVYMVLEQLQYTHQLHSAIGEREEGYYATVHSFLLIRTYFIRISRLRFYENILATVYQEIFTSAEDLIGGCGMSGGR